MKANFTIHNLQEIPDAIRWILNASNGEKVLAFIGEMGAGKTTLISEFCRQLGSNDRISSPTFSIVNEYLDGYGNPIYHFDFYRIKNIKEAAQIGFDEYLESGNFCFIEWPQLVKELLPDNCIWIEIKEIEDQKRQISFN